MANSILTNEAVQLLRNQFFSNFMCNGNKRSPVDEINKVASSNSLKLQNNVLYPMTVSDYELTVAVLEVRQILLWLSTDNPLCHSAYFSLGSTVYILTAPDKYGYAFAVYCDDQSDFAKLIKVHARDLKDYEKMEPVTVHSICKRMNLCSFANEL